MLHPIKDLQRQWMRGEPLVCWCRTDTGATEYHTVSDAVQKLPLFWVRRPVFKETGVGSGFWREHGDAVLWDGKYLRRYRHGFTFDGESVPHAVQWYEKPDSCLEAALPHDYHYRYHYAELWNPLTARWEWCPVTKIGTDWLFHRIYEMERPAYHGHAIVTSGAVVLFGWPAWYGNVCNGGCFKPAKKCPDDSTDSCPYYGSNEGGFPPAWK